MITRISSIPLLTLLCSQHHSFLLDYQITIIIAVPTIIIAVPIIWFLILFDFVNYFDTVNLSTTVPFNLVSSTIVPFNLKSSTTVSFTPI